MRQLYVMAVLVCIFILAGCGSASDNKEASGIDTATTVTNDSGSSSDGAENKEGQTNESQAKDAEKSAEVKEAEEAKAVTDADEAKETAKKEEKEEVKEPKKSKQTQEVKKAIAENKAANAAVKGSIMNKNESQAPAAKNADIAGMEKAVKEIRSLAKDLKQKAEDGDAVGVKAIAGDTIQAWDAVKSDIKANVADMYPFLDEKMKMLAEQTNTEEIDLEAVIQIDYQIYQGFRQLAEKLGIE